MYSYQDCYKILSIESSCDWPGARKAYKQKIQKWHPDRITDAAKKSSAEDKLKELNLAYEQLSIYYKKHGYLPAQIKQSEIDTESIEVKPDRSRKQPAEQTAKPSESVKNSTASSTLNVSRQSSVLSLVVFTVLGLVMYSLLDFESPDAGSMKNTEQNQQSSSTLQENSKAKSNYESEGLTKLNTSKDELNSSSEEDDSHIKTEYFTIGSSTIDVLRVQGTPDSVVDNTWFYGESSVEFEDGVVKDWKRSVANPLNAHMDL